jgi:beta-glucosidase
MLTKQKTTIKHLIQEMNLDEKLAQLGSYWLYDLQMGGKLDDTLMSQKLGSGIGQITRVAGASASPPRRAAQMGNQIQKFLVEQTRLGIPAILHEESCAGAMILGGSVFPQMIGLASTFQPELAKRMTEQIRKQLLAIGARQALAPVLDIGREPRWGRIEETFGEDPILVSQFGVAYVQGLQSEDLRQGVMATGKHFIGHSYSLGGLNCNPVLLGKHEIYDTYLQPFQAAIRDAGLASMMNAYPELDGEVVAASAEILTELLREKLGFDGVVVSDYEAVLMIHNFHYMAKDLSTAGRLALRAGIDVELPTVVCYGDALKEALESGTLSIETVDLAVERHLDKKQALGLFDNPYVNEEIVLDSFETKTDRHLALEIAKKSMVLLKNDGSLPLSKSIKKLAVIGPNADSARAQMGDYSYHATLDLMLHQIPPESEFEGLDKTELKAFDIKVTTVLEGIKNIVSAETEILYTPGCSVNNEDTSEIKTAVSLAAEADAVVLVLGDLSGLTPGSTTGEFRDDADLQLPGVQRELAEAVMALGKPVVVVLINGRPYAAPWLKEKANSILEAWIPGEEGGAAAAAILFGDVNPSGKLPLSIAPSVGQLPIYYNHKPSGMKSNIYGDYVKEKIGPLYPFGFGLSFTTFDYSNLNIQQTSAGTGETVKISLVVKNTGEVSGDEIVQLYVRDEFASSPRPVKELKGFARVTLAPGEEKEITFHLPVNQLAFINKDLKLVLESGTIKVLVGSSSEDIRLQGMFEIRDNATLPLNQRVFVCPVTVN